MTSTAIFGAWLKHAMFAGACDVRRRVEEKPETREARGGTCKVEWMLESRVL